MRRLFVNLDRLNDALNSLREVALKLTQIVLSTTGLKGSIRSQASKLIKLLLWQIPSELDNLLKLSLLQQSTSKIL